MTEDYFRDDEPGNFHGIVCCSMIGAITLIVLNFTSGIMYYDKLANNVLIWYNIVSGIIILLDTSFFISTRYYNRYEVISAAFSLINSGIIAAVGMILCIEERSQFPSFVFSISISTLIVYIFIAAIFSLRSVN